MTDKESFDDIAEQLLGDRDVDDDSVPNYADCRPLDPERQDIRGGLSALASKIKGKYKELKGRKKAAERGEEIKKDVERRKELEELEEKRKGLREKREVAEAEKKLEEEKRKLEEAEPPGTLEKIIGAIGKGAKKTRKGGTRKRSVDSDDRWAVVDYPQHSIVATFEYKTDAKNYAGGSDRHGAMRTKTALKRGYRPRGSTRALAGGGGSGDLEALVIGSGRGGFDIAEGGSTEEEETPWWERGLV